MANEDTIKLIKECNSGIKGAIASFDEVLKSVKSKELKQRIEDCKKAHEDWEDKTHNLLNQYHYHDKEANLMVKMMSWIKIKMKLMQNKKDAQIAQFIVDGCNMRINSLYKYMKQYHEADQESHYIVEQLIILEEHLMVDLRQYL